MRRVGYLFLVGLALPFPLCAYMTWIPTYDELSKQAEVVVIAVPVERRELAQPAVIPGVTRGDQPIPAVEIRTTFEVSAVLGGKEISVGQRLELRHYRETEPPSAWKSAGPFLIDFDPSKPASYLMFVKRNAEGFFEAVNPVEPGWCIEKLIHPAERPAA